MFSISNKLLLADKVMLRQIQEAQDRDTSFVLDPTATPQQSREMMIAQGIHPEDNAFSCEIRRMREGE